MNRDILLKQSDSFDYWLSWCALVVVIGLLIEVYEIAHEHKKSRNARILSLKFLTKVIGSIIITLGVYGEYALGKKHSETLKLIRQMDDLEIATLHERASHFEKEAEVVKLARTNLEIQLAKIRQRQEPRRISPFRIMAALRDKPKGIAEVLYLQGDVEAFIFAQEIAIGLTHSGWQLDKGPRPLTAEHKLKELDVPDGDPQKEAIQSLPLLSLAGAGTGITFIVHALPPQKDTPEQVLSELFLKCGFNISMSVDRYASTNKLRIIIGPKE